MKNWRQFINWFCTYYPARLAKKLAPLFHPIRSENHFMRANEVLLVWISRNWVHNLPDLKCVSKFLSFDLALSLSLSFSYLQRHQFRPQMCFKILVIWFSFVFVFVFFLSSATSVSIFFSIQMNTLFTIFHLLTHCKYISHLILFSGTYLEKKHVCIQFNWNKLMTIN